MKCIVINLKRALDRKKFMSNQLNNLSIDFEFFEGVDWKNIDSSLLTNTVPNIKLKNSYRKLSLGYMGCNFSHRHVLRWLANQSKEKMVTILEDDVLLSTDFPRVLNLIENSTQKFDIIFLSKRHYERDYLVNLKSLSDKYFLALSRREEAGALGYVITKSAAQEFLRILPDVTGPIDDALHAYYLHGLTTYTLNPQIVLHGEIGINYSYNLENTSEGKSFRDEILRLFPKYYGYLLHQIYFRKRVTAEKELI